MIKTSTHSLKFANTNKRNLVTEFIREYRKCAKVIIDDIWANGYDYDINGISKRFHVASNLLEVPTYIDYKKFSIESNLTARALSSLVTQLVGILKASVEKQRKRLHMLERNKGSGSQNTSLIKKIKQNIPQKPDVSKINPELSSKCAKFEMSPKSFDGVLHLYSTMVGVKSISLPIRFHSHSNKLMGMGTLKTSFLVKEHSVDFRWEIEQPKKKEDGKVIGADQGAKTVLTLSDAQTTNKDIHGHDLHSIMQKMSSKRKGSKAFRRSQEHRRNYINWSINQLDLTDVKQINLEKIWNIGYRNSRSRFLSHFTNTLIRDKIEDFATLHGVHVEEQSSTYRSQRCSCCGVVRKANRKGKLYECINCGNMMDADLNAAKNHEIQLPEIPYTLRKMNLNRGKGFLWKPDGFFDLSGRSIESLPPVEDI